MKLFYTISYPLSVLIPRKKPLLALITLKRSLFIKMAQNVEVRFFFDKINLISLKVQSMFFRNICTSFRNVLADLCYGYAKYLRLQGMGYKVHKEGRFLLFSLGLTHKTYIKLLRGTFVSTITKKQTMFAIFGWSRLVVSKMVSNILLIKQPDPYKNKGVLLLGKPLITKLGKGTYK